MLQIVLDRVFKNHAHIVASERESLAGQTNVKPTHDLRAYQSQLHVEHYRTTLTSLVKTCMLLLEDPCIVSITSYCLDKVLGGSDRSSGNTAIQCALSLVGSIGKGECMV